MTSDEEEDQNIFKGSKNKISQFENANNRIEYKDLEFNAVFNQKPDRFRNLQKDDDSSFNEKSGFIAVRNKNSIYFNNINESKLKLNTGNSTLNSLRPNTKQKAKSLKIMNRQVSLYLFFAHYSTKN